jgi:hypothetical protein
VKAKCKEGEGSREPIFKIKIEQTKEQKKQ